MSKNILISRQELDLKLLNGLFLLWLLFFFLLLKPVALSADSYILVDHTSGHILDSLNPNRKGPIASLTKIATAVVVLDASERGLIRLNEIAEIPPEAHQLGGHNPAGLLVGDQISLRDLLYCAMMASDNIAALTLAHYVGQRLPNYTSLDPVGNFVAHMNALARGLGMKHTLFLNPHGIDAGKGPHGYSTPADLARLCRYAYTDGDLHFFVSQPWRKIEIVRNGQKLELPLSNTNKLLGVEGIDGIKTGFTSKAGFCLALSSWKQPEVIRLENGVSNYPRRLIVILLAAASDNERFSLGLQLVKHGWILYEDWKNKGRPTDRKTTL
ncbi:MAG: serine hydrolase [Chthoniobacterales bacterium]|nr:serine hydrolase [Chthoniobacterales bacterium]